MGFLFSVIVVCRADVGFVYRVLKPDKAQQSSQLNVLTAFTSPA